MRPRRFTFVMEQTLGHIPFAQNLRRAFDADKEITVNWIPITFPIESWLEKLPVIRNNWSLRASLKARRAINAERKTAPPPDLYLFHTQVISLLSAGWLRGKIPVVVSLDATPLNYDRVGTAYGHSQGNPQLEKFKFWLNRRAFHGSTYLITWSEWARQSLINDYGLPADKVEVIPPGTNLDFWKLENEANKPAHPEGKTRLLFVGGDFERKGGKLLYDNFRRYLSESCELHLVTQGKVETGNGVFVHRNITPNSPELQALFRQADVFVLPTEGDCLPVAITEALAAGLPVVSTRVGAIEEAVVNGENGFVITPNNGTELTQVLTQLANDPELRRKMGLKSRALAETSFDAAKNGQRLLTICKALADSKQVPPVSGPDRSALGYKS
ncbi:MAG: glycosyltransferase family 4 protein [Chloroflexi bacterium]|nr:glycosyltransferase family 4 protein [Chloroflexota bacterium]